MAPGYSKCRSCQQVKDRKFLDHRMRCEECNDTRCGRCRTLLQDDGACLRCLEVEVATDAEVANRQAKGVADALGNQMRPRILAEDDEYNAYSGGVYEYNVDDDEIATIREFDSRNEWRREMRALQTTNGVCPFCWLEVSESERRTGAHDECMEALSE